MGLQLIPIAVGTAFGAAAAYIITDQRLRSRIADESMQLGCRISAYFTGPSTGDEQTEPTAPVAPAQQQPQPVWHPHQGFTDLADGDKQTESATADAEQQAPQPARQPEQHRCEAMTKAGNRCRSKTHAVVSMSLGAAGTTEVALCSVHSRIHEQGGTFALVGSSE